MTGFWLILYILITSITFLTIIFYGSRPSRSLSWILVIVLIPFVGVLLYIIFGINRRKIKFFTLKHTVKRKLYDKTHIVKSKREVSIHFDSVKKQKLAQLLINNNNYLPYDGNQLTILNEGKTTFETIFDTLEKAEKFIHLQYYIFEEGELLHRLLDLFERKIKEGVEIRILYDAIGSFYFKKKSIRRLKALGVKVYPIMPISYGSILFTLNFRNHRKIIIIDGKVGFTGGYNISDKYIKKVSELGVWSDMHLRIAGPVVDSLHKIFIKDYYFASKKESLLTEKYLPTLEKTGNSTVQIVASGPDSDYAAVMQQYIKLINLAEKYVYITNPYFIPSVVILEALKIAALSGVKIKILVPEKSDSKLAKHSMFSYFEELMEAGVEIHLKTDSFLHSKVLLIDNEIASVGSGNFDSRSFEHNFETNAVIYDEHMVKEIRKLFDEECAQCTHIDLKEFKNRPLLDKLIEGLSRFFSPLL